MTKEELKALGLTDEQIAEVFKINGKDIEKAKGDLKTKETELETLQGQLKTANKQIEDFKEMDVEGIKKAADEYKTKFEEAQANAQKEIEALKFEHSLESALTKAGAKNVKAAKALLDIEILRSSKNIDSDLETAISTLKETDNYLFGEIEPTGTGGSLGGGEKPKGDGDNKVSTNDFISAIREVQAKRE